MINWSIQTRNIKDLKKYEQNPRKLTKEQFKQIKTSIDKFGLIEKPIINLDNTIISGHQRIEILKKDKMKQVECWVPDEMLDSFEVEELCLRMNRNHGDFDYDILANEFHVPDLLDFGFTVEELHLIDADELDEEEKKETEDKLKCIYCGK